MDMKMYAVSAGAVFPPMVWKYISILKLLLHMFFLLVYCIV